MTASHSLQKLNRLSGLPDDWEPTDADDSPAPADRGPGLNATKESGQVQRDDRPNIARTRSADPDVDLPCLPAGDLPEPSWNAWIAYRHGDAFTGRDFPVWLYVRLSPTELHRYGFLRFLDAYRFYAWNETDQLCQLCCRDRAWFSHGEPPVPELQGLEGYCLSCRDVLQNHRLLVRRYERAAQKREQVTALYERMKRMREFLGEGEATQADKAAVLDRLLEDAALDIEEETA